MRSILGLAPRLLSDEEIDAVCVEIGTRYAPLVVFLVETALRPEEAFGLTRADLDLHKREIVVRRRYSDGELKQGTKTVPERVVPLSDRALAALKSLPARLDTAVLFPAQRGGHLDIEKFRHRHWHPRFARRASPTVGSTIFGIRR